MTAISDKQLEVLQCIHKIIDMHGYPPTVREIGAAVGLSSTSTVHGHLSRLEKNGFIIRGTSKTRAIEVTDLGLEVLGISSDQIPLLGKVAAGTPILAVEEALDYYPLPPNLRYDPDELFMLEITGDSMVNAGILDGDLITVRQQVTANNGEIVIAMTEEDEVTCKTFYQEADHYILRPENDFMDDIIVSQATILGKVVSLYREF